MGREPCHYRSHGTSLCRALSPKDLLLLSSIKPFPPWNQECAEGWAIYPLPPHSAASAVASECPQLLLCPLGPPALSSTFLLSCEVLRAIPATGDGSHWHCHFPILFPAAEVEIQQVCRFCYKVCTPWRSWVSQNRCSVLLIFPLSELLASSLQGEAKASQGWPCESHWDCC